MTFLGLSPGQKLVGQLALALASVHLGAFQSPKADASCKEGRSELQLVDLV